jgi:RHS repeat-associated protein
VVVSDRKFGQQLYGYTANTSGTGTHTYNTLANEYVYVASGGNFDQTSNTNETSYDVYLPEVLSFSDYYPFLMKMPGRNNNSAGYRYQGQGQEEDNEFTEGFLSFEYRVHDPRIGRFLSVDPLRQDYAYNSTYAFSENRVIDAVELEGLEKIWYQKKYAETWKSMLNIMKTNEHLNEIYKSISDEEKKSTVGVRIFFAPRNGKTLGGANGISMYYLGSMAYWHNKFKQREANGEILNLSDSDLFELYKQTFGEIGMNQSDINRFADETKNGGHAVAIIIAHDLIPENFAKENIESISKLITTFAHEIEAHMAPHINEHDFDQRERTVEQHKAYFNTKGNEDWYKKNQSAIDAGYTPDGPKPKNSPAGKTEAAIKNAVNKVIK